jgi:hypothetical protein
MAYVKNESTQTYMEQTSSTTHVLSSQMTGINAIDDILILNISPDAGRTVTTPSGWTQLRQNSSGGTGHTVLWRRATADNETLPTLTINANDSLGAQYIVVYGCPTGSTPIGNDVSNTGSNNSPVWNSVSYSAHSCILYLASIDAQRTLDAIDNGSLILPQEVGTGSSAAAAKDYDSSSGSSGTVTGTISASDGWQTYTLELLDNGVGEEPIRFSNTPAEDFPVLLPVDNNFWRDAITDSQVEPDTGSAVASAVSFDANTDVDTINNRITITSHGITDGRIYRADANGNTLPTGITDGHYYYISVFDSNTIELVDQDGLLTSNTVNAANGPYANGGHIVVGISATGSGTCRFEFCGFHQLDFTKNGDDGWNRFSAVCEAHGNAYSAGIKFTSPRDMSNERFSSYFETPSSVKDNFAFLTIIDSDGDYKTWKAQGVTSKTTQDNIQIRPSNALEVYEHGTFDDTIVDTIVFWFRGDSDDGRLGDVTDWEVSRSQILRKADVIGGMGTIEGTWDDVYYELQLYTSETSNKAAGTISQLIFSQILQFGDGTNDVNFNDNAKSVEFLTPSNGTNEFERYIIDVGVRYYLTPGSSIDIGSSLMSSPVTFENKVDPLSNSSATLSITNTVLNGADILLDTNNEFTGCTVSNSPEASFDGANVENCVFTNTLSTDAVLGLVSNDTVKDTSIDAGISDYHIELGTAVTAVTLDNITFTGTPDVDKIHVLRTTGTVDITISGTTSLVAGDVTSAGAAINIISSPVTVTVTVTTISGTPIENARVYLITSPGGTEILNTLTNASGVATTTYSGSTPQAVEGWVRKASGSPNYKQFPLGGNIASTGYDSTALMTLDE